MLGLVLLFVMTSSSKGSGASYYPLMVPLHTGGHHHRHTTHIVTHPVVHTRVLVLGDDDHHHHHKHNHGHNHLHQHGHDHKHGHHHAHKHFNHHNSGLHERKAVHGRSNYHGLQNGPRHKTKARYQYRGNGGYYGGHYDDEYPYHDQLSYKEPLKYSVPVSESPWKPLHRVPNHVPKGYLPLKYLGIDEETVARAVNDAMADMDKDMGRGSHSKLPTSIKDLIHSPVKPLPTAYRGAIFYDEDEAPKSRHLPSKPRHEARYYGPMDSPSKDPQTFKLNFECHCEAPHAR